MSGPLDMVFHPEDDRRYVAEQRGVVQILNSEGIREDPLLDLRDSVVAGGEQGLLGLALHPEFPTDRRLFVRYSAAARTGTPSEYSHTFVLAEFRVASDGLAVVPGSERTILEIPQPQANHNAGAIEFGPDGYLYVAVGDGGAGGDQGTGHADDWYDAVDGGNGQDVTENLLGSILRLDVDDADDATNYGIPPTNPLVDRPGLDEQFAWGFRNPWRFGFDGEDLYVGDVGQNRFEEVSVVRRGGNYGWNVKEGTHCFGADDCPDRTPKDIRGGERLQDPVIEYPHSGGAVSGVSVIAGNVYRGNALRSLQGRYVFGDFLLNGRLFVATPTDGGLWPTTTLTIAEEDADRVDRLLSITRHDGQLYLLGTGRDGGGLYRLEPGG